MYASYIHRTSIIDICFQTKGKRWMDKMKMTSCQAILKSIKTSSISFQGLGTILCIKGSSLHTFSFVLYDITPSSSVGYSPWGGKESGTTERLHFHLKQWDLVVLSKAATDVLYLTNTSHHIALCVRKCLFSWTVFYQLSFCFLFFLLDSFFDVDHF